MSKDKQQIQQIQKIKDLAIYILELKFSLEKLKESIESDKLDKYIDTIIANKNAMSLRMLGPTTTTLMKSSADLVVHMKDFKKELEALKDEIEEQSKPKTKP
jgi:phage regulator Rha-like protein